MSTKRTRGMLNLLNKTMATPNKPLYAPKRPKKAPRNASGNGRLSNVAGIISNVISKRPEYNTAKNLAILRETSRVMKNLIPTKELQKADIKYKKDTLKKMVRNANRNVSNDNRLYASINREVAERVYMKNFVNTNAFKANYKKALQELDSNNYAKGKAAYDRILTSLVRASHRAIGL